MTTLDLTRLPDPDMVGSSEYLAVFELVTSVVDSAEHDDATAEEVTDLVRGALGEVAGWARRVAADLGLGPADGWALSRERPDAFADWGDEARAGDTTLGFVEWCAHRDEAERS